MRPARLIVFCLLAGLTLPAAAQAQFGPAAPYENTRPPEPTYATTVTAVEVGTGGTSNQYRLRITRSFADGTPAIVAETQGNGRRPAFVSVAHNASRDALIAWSDSGSSVVGINAVFWPAGAAAPTATHELQVGSGSSGGPVHPALDASRSATVVWGRGSDVWTESSADLGAADPWPGSPSVLASGEPHVCSGSAFASGADGRALYALKDFVATPGGPTTGYLRIRTWARVPGQGYAGGGVVAGAAVPSRTAGCAQMRAAVAPGGRAALAYDTSVNVPSQTCPFTQTNRAQVEMALGSLTPAGPDLTTAVVSAPDQDASMIEPFIVGQDDRFGVRWREVGGQFCDNNRPVRPNFAFTTPGSSPTTTGPPPAVFSSWWFQCDGNLYFAFVPPGGSAMGTVYDTGSASTCAPPGGGGPTGPTGPTGTVGPTGTAGPGGANPGGGGGVIQIPTVTTALTPSKDGKVKLTLLSTVDGDYQIDLLARRTGLIAAAKLVKVGSYQRSATKDVPLTVKLKLKGRAARTLKRKGKLKIKVRTSFTAASGGEPVVGSKSVTFKKR